MSARRTDSSAWCCGGDDGSAARHTDPHPRPPNRVPTSRWSSPAARSNRPVSVGSGSHSSTRFASQAAGKSVSVYPVNYPASTDFPTAVQGIRDAANRIEATAAGCPDTKIVLGGFSQGAAVAGFVTSEAVPSGADATEVPDPMPPEIADHVAAVVLLREAVAQVHGGHRDTACRDRRLCMRPRRSTCVSPTIRSARAPATARTTASTTRTE